jgi:hypothetical protein
MGFREGHRAAGHGGRRRTVIRAIPALAAAAAIVLVGCKTRGKAPDAAEAARLAERAGISLPAGSEVLLAETDERKDGGHARWVVRGPSAVAPPGVEATEIPPASTLDLLARILPREPAGKPAEPSARMYEWRHAGGSWRALTLKTDRTCWSVVERLPL